MKGKVLKLAGAVGLVATGTRIAEAAGVQRLQCACEDDCWCKKPGLSMFRWLVPGRFHHQRPPETD